jgi:hypothetical protein
MRLHEEGDTVSGVPLGLLVARRDQMFGVFLE